MLAVALPLTFHELVRDVASPEKDFARSVVGGSGRALEAAWHELYFPKVVALCARVAERARSLGATVEGIGCVHGAMVGAHAISRKARLRIRGAWDGLNRTHADLTKLTLADSAD